METIACSPDSISIKDSKGEIVYWDKQEWLEDPSLIISIANACYLAGKNKCRQSLSIKK